MIESAGLPAFVEQRLRVLALLATAGFLGLGFRLFQLQILRGSDMERMAELNRTQVIPLRAPRGVVMDRHGEVLLDNAPLFSVFYSARSVSRAAESKLEAELVVWLPGAASALHRKIAEARQTGKMTRVASGVARESALALIEKRLTLPGMNVIVEPQRRTRFGPLASHVLGYVDEIGPAELERRRDEGYRMGQLIGKIGVEKVYDAQLRGSDGGLQFEMDAGGRHVHAMRRIPSEPGDNLFLTIDRRLQEVVERGLRASSTQRGAAVVMDPRSGRVLALASQPDFDPSADLLPSLGDPGLPLFSRALQGSYPPGSVFKIVTAVAALETGWDLAHTVNCPGVFRLGSKEFGCWKVHHLQDFMGAVAWSCNVYFYNLGLKIGPDPIERAARAFGLGLKTGIDLPSESSGLIPGRRWKQEAQKSVWFDGDTVNFAIGQGAVSVTPLQAAVMMSAVANGGVVWRPFVVEKVVSPEGRVRWTQTPTERWRADVQPAVLRTLREALGGVVARGTGRGVWRPDLVLGAKSGTAQNPHGEDHAWFAAYAGRPGEDASLVVVVCVEHGGRGSAAAGPVAREVINTAFPREDLPS